MIEPLHQDVKRIAGGRLRHILIEPLPEDVVQRAVLGSRPPPGLLQETFVGRKGDVLHEFLVHENSAHVKCGLIAAD